MSSAPIPNPDLAEEIDAISAIYDPSTLVICPDSTSNSPVLEEATTTTVTLRVPEHTQIAFLLRFDDKYPETAPQVTGTASTGSRGEGKKWVDMLSDAVARVWTPGSVCLYDLIVEAGEMFDEAKAAEQEAEKDEGASDYTEQLANLDINASSSQAILSSMGLDEPPSWIMSDPFSEKRSVFIARAAHVQSKEQAEKYLDYLLATEKKVAAATHNITAWRIRQKKADGSTAVMEVIPFYEKATQPGVIVIWKKRPIGTISEQPQTKTPLGSIRTHAIVRLGGASAPNPVDKLSGGEGFVSIWKQMMESNVSDQSLIDACSSGTLHRFRLFQPPSTGKFYAQQCKPLGGEFLLCPGTKAVSE
ncbi:predicted protein [Uncinocarpus reesii 1704]|uniref:RWD domain-containing protein n=1 Tax=Uncinocarpus reesii (strain UAMH 1704) TaxID=336963 RepID=C4JM66_UNCRE|nr:uncharacterized protein UREG_03924 [Uncinocarpus reesii 1704]EEP79078.1 predicted protein [Uncinocarpus reesii 1704]